MARAARIASVDEAPGVRLERALHDHRDHHATVRRPWWSQAAGGLAAVGGGLIGSGLFLAVGRAIAGDLAVAAAFLGMAALGLLLFGMNMCAIRWWWTGNGRRDAAFAAHGVCSWCHSEDHTLRRCGAYRSRR